MLKGVSQVGLRVAAEEPGTSGLIEMAFCDLKDSLRNYLSCNLDWSNTKAFIQQTFSFYVAIIYDCAFVTSGVCLGSAQRPFAIHFYINVTIPIVLHTVTPAVPI